MSTPNVNSPASSTRVPSSQTEQDGAPATAPDNGYPPQRHAGAVGLGPEYGKGTSASGTDRIQGLKEELVGKILHKPQKVQHGHDLRTGELKRREREENEPHNPFQSIDTGDDKPGASSKKDEGLFQSQGETTGTEKHLSPAGEKEQAATVAPEGTDEAERQREGQANPKIIG
ncbi:hypothetical protein QCA50_007153 [Cerrena zonata]|uniref:Uncharacterized protein n=1 Tax=Cerrena zonata TaxID=2478898 RepID=A0AAW0GAE3_9APHY